MKQSIFTIKSNTNIAPNTYKMVLAGDTSAITCSGQFINIKIEGLFLRRPLSVCDYDGESFTVLYKTVGKGTDMISDMKAGEKLDVLTGLGNGFDTSKSGLRPLLIGGGAGISPMYRLAKDLIDEGKKPEVILGFNKKEEIFFEEEFKALGLNVHISTIDGSRGTKGFVSDVIKQLSGYTYFYTCGPEPMLKAVSDAADTSGQLSFEARMGCGFGACMGCSCETKYGSKRICKDGPVLQKEEVIW